MKKHIITWTIALIITLQLVSAIGISPASKSLFYEPNQKQTLTYHIFNNEQKAINISIKVEGVLADYIQLSQEKVELFQFDEKVPFTITLLHSPFLKPGPNEASIIIEEIIPSGMTVASRQRLISKLRIITPYPEKYVEAEFDVTSIPPNTYMSSTITNFGSVDIDDAYASFAIYGLNQKKDSIDSRHTKLPSRDKETLDVLFDTSSYKPGEYQAKAKIIYDEKELLFSKDFRIGSLDFNLEYYDQYYIINHVNKIKLNLISNWNRPLENVFLDIYVYKDRREITRLRTSPETIEPDKLKTFIAYWNTDSLELGEYEFTLLIKHGSEIVTKKVKVNLVTAELYEKLAKKSYTPYYIMAQVVILLLIILFYQYLLMRRKRSRKKAKGVILKKE